jgi:hypothetical protein
MISDTHRLAFARALSPIVCGFRAFGGMMPPCVLPAGHTGDHADGFGGHYGAGLDGGYCSEKIATVQA